MLIETLLCAYSTASSVLVAISGGSITFSISKSATQPDSNGQSGLLRNLI